MFTTRTLQAMAAAFSALSILLTIPIVSAVDGAGIGVNYGRLANNLPPPAQVAQFLAHNTIIDRVKLFDADPLILRAFANVGLAVDVTVPNDLIPDLTDLAFAAHWVRTHILPHAPATNIARILVGNEVISTANRSLIASLVPAMQNLHTALVGVSLHRRIKVSSPHSLGILAASDPPSVGRFRQGYYTQVIRPMLSFLRATKSAFMVNAYPFFGFTVETLDFALFRPNRGVVDPNTGLMYSNMLDGQLDAVFSAMKRLGFSDVKIVVAESGWPSIGDAGEIGVDLENARDYNKNLLELSVSGVGTPLMPNRSIEVNIFALFNEDRKPGPTSERNFGLFYPDMMPVYDIGILRKESGERREPIEPPAGPAPADWKRWCIPNSNAGLESLQANIDYVCGLGFDCRPIQPGGACFSPNTVRAHAAFAMNEYYQATGRNPFDCDFRQTGIIAAVDPSYGNCEYKS